MNKSYRVILIIFLLSCEHKSEKEQFSTQKNPTILFEVIYPKNDFNQYFDKVYSRNGLKRENFFTRKSNDFNYIKLKVNNESKKNIFFEAYDSILNLRKTYEEIIEKKIVEKTYPITESLPGLKSSIVILEPSQNALFDLIYPFYIDDGLKNKKKYDTLTYYFRYTDIYPSDNNSWYFHYQIQLHFVLEKREGKNKLRLVRVSN